ncbi:MAG: hypothetical protein KDA21_09365, partial [Phycisphaerales bacterium]|nr:hypothetical protein [Phycisphaerales bacterium]
MFDIAGNATAPALSQRFFSVLPGDVTGDHRVNNTDLGAIAALTSEALIDVDNWFARRCDLNRDGYVNEADTQIAFPLRGHDLRFTPLPPSLDEDATPRAAQWNQPGLIADRTRPDHLDPLSSDQDDTIDAGSSAPRPSTAGSEFVAGQPLRREPGRTAILTPGHDLSLDGSHAANWTIHTTDALNLDLPPGTYQSPVFLTRGNQPVLVSPDLLVLLDDESAGPDVTRQLAAAGLTLHLNSSSGTSKLLHVTTPFDHADDVLTLADAISRWPHVAACEPVMLVAFAADLTPVRNPADGLVERMALDAAHTITRGHPTCHLTILGSTSTATLASSVLTDQHIGITPDCTIHHEIMAHPLSPLGDMASTLDVARALTEATTRGDRIITIPGTLGARSVVLTRLFQSSTESGITLIAPEANRAWPASLPAFIGVDGAQAGDNPPPTPGIVHAPALTRSPGPDDHTGTIGTAVSTLATAGVAALLQSWDDTLTPQDTAAALTLGHDTTGTLTAWHALSAARLPGDTDFDGDVD